MVPLGLLLFALYFDNRYVFSCQSACPVMSAVLRYVLLIVVLRYVTSRYSYYVMF